MRAAAVLLTALLLLAAHPRPAAAHATLIRSFPAYGQNLDNAPPDMELEFNEAVVAAFTPLTVRNAKGERVDAGDAAVDPKSPNRLTVSLKPLEPGLYTAVYRVTSHDGHPVEGAIAFTVGAPDGASAAAPTEPPSAKTPPVVSLVHGLSQLTATLLAGLAAFLALVAPGALRRPGRWGLTLAAALAAIGLAEVSLYAVRASGEPWSLTLLARGLFGTRIGYIWLIRMALGAAAGGALAMAGRLKWLALLPGLGLLLAFSLQSHAAATGRTVAVAADWLHLVALAPWVGGLAGFAAGGTRPDLVPRFSRVAILSVLLLAATGVYSAGLHVPSWQALWTTYYGKALLWKLLLLAPTLALGAYNLLRKGQGWFRQSVQAELALVFATFAAAGFLTSLPPAHVELALRQGPFSETATAGGYIVELRVTPNRLGFNQATIILAGPDGQPEAKANAGLRLTMPAHDMGLQNLNARESAPGTYQVRDLVLGMPGEWHAEVVALTKGGREIRYAFKVSVPSPP